MSDVDPDQATRDEPRIPDDERSPQDGTPSVRLEPATGAGREWVVSLLDRTGLPTADLTADVTREDGPALFVVVADGRRVGCIGIERVDDVALLRSAAVVDGYRGEGYGTAAVRALEREASEAGVETLYLLTTTAAPFFERLGYETVDRAAIPVELEGSREVSDLCPESATVQRKSL